MRALSALLFLFAAGCGQSFDERYAETEKELQAKAAEMDRALEPQVQETPSAAGQGAAQGRPLPASGAKNEDVPR